MAKLRVTFEVNTEEMFDTLAKVNDGGAACASRLIEPLLTGQIGWGNSVGLAVYGIEFKGSECLEGSLKNNLTKKYPDDFLAVWDGCAHLDCLPECRHGLGTGYCERLERAFSEWQTKQTA